MFARPSLRSRLAGSGADHPSNESGGRSGARHSEEPRGLRSKRTSSQWAQPRTGVPSSPSHVTVRAPIGTEGSPSSEWRRLPYGAAPKQRLQVLHPSGQDPARHLAGRDGTSSSTAAPVHSGRDPDQGSPVARRPCSGNTPTWLEQLRDERPGDAALLRRIAGLHREAGRHGALLRVLISP